MFPACPQQANFSVSLPTYITNKCLSHGDSFLPHPQVFPLSLLGISRPFPVRPWKLLLITPILNWLHPGHLPVYHIFIWSMKRKEGWRKFELIPLSLLLKWVVSSCFLLLFSSGLLALLSIGITSLDLEGPPLPRLNQKVLCSCPLRTRKRFPRAGLL